MDFKTCDLVAAQIEQMKTAEVPRADQRALLNQFFNGAAPFTEQEAKDTQQTINFNDKQGCNLLHQARNQFENAFDKRESYFKVYLPDCKDDQKDDWEAIITREINKVLKDSREWYYTQDEVWGGVCLHGVGMKVWWDDQDPIPRFVGIQDALFPTETHLSMTNLQCFSARRKMRPGELFRTTLGRGKNIIPGWDLKAVKKLLDEYKDLNQNPNSYNFYDHPEQAVELWKQQSAGGYFDSDICPEIWFWDFFHREEGLDDKEPGWYRKLILDRDCTVGRTNSAAEPLAFIFESKEPYARKLDEFIHFQFGDGNNVPPFMYHSIRSLAYLTYELVWTLNRLNCQFTQSMFEQLMTFIRIADPNDRGRLNRVVLTPPFAILPDGLSIVPATERYQPDWNLIEGGLAQYKQRIGELTNAYTQQLDTGTQKERTKFEVQTVLAQTSALMSSMLGRAYRQELFAYKEIARRFAIKNSHNFDVKKFRTACIMAEIPEKWLEYSRWHIEADQVLGNGNRAMEIAEATELFQAMPQFDPAAQAEIKHMFALAITGDPAKARRLAPINPKASVSIATHDAQQSFSSLMLGIRMKPVEGLNHVEQVMTLLACMATVIDRITKTGGVGTPQDVLGLQNVAVYIGEHLQIMSKVKKNKKTVHGLGQILGKLMNLVKAFAQRQQQAQSKNGQQLDPETMAKIQAIVLEAQTKSKVKEAQAAQGLKHKELKFQQSQRQKQAQTAADIHQQGVRTIADIAIKGAGGRNPGS